MIKIQEQAALALASYFDGMLSFQQVAQKFLNIAINSSGAYACALYQREFGGKKLILEGEASSGDINRIDIEPILRGVAERAIKNMLRPLKEKLPEILPARYMERAADLMPEQSEFDAIACHIIDMPIYTPSKSSDGGYSVIIDPLQQSHPYTGVCVVYIPGYFQTKTTREPSEEGRSRMVVLDRLTVYFSLLLKHEALRRSETHAKLQTESRLNEVATIHELSEAIDNSNISELFSLIVLKAAEVMNANACSLLMKDDKSNTLQTAASSGSISDMLENARLFIAQGLAQKALETRSALLETVNSVDPAKKTVKYPASCIAMPLTDELDAPVGVLCIHRAYSQPQFDEFDARLFNIFANIAVQAIKNAKLYTKLRAKYNELANLSTLTEAISSKLDLGYVLDQFAATVSEAGCFDKCWVYVRDDADSKSGWRLPYLIRGFADRSIQNFDTPELLQLVEGVANRQLPVYIESRINESEQLSACAETIESESIYVHPVVVRGETVGVIGVGNNSIDSVINLDGIDIVSTFVQHAGVAIENARLYNQMASRVNELNALYSMSRALSTSYGLNRTCSIVTRFSAQIAKCDIALLILLDDRMETLHVQSHFGSKSDMDTILRFLPDTQLSASELLQIREPIRLAPGEDEQQLWFGSKWRTLTDKMNTRYSHQLLTPLIAEEQLSGYLWLGRIEGSQFDHYDEKLVGIVASHAASVIRSAATYEQSFEQRVLELNALYELSKKVRSADTFADTLTSLLDIVTSIVFCDSAMIYTAKDGQYSVTAQSPNNRSISEIILHSLSGNVTTVEWTMQERKALLSADIELDPRFVSQSTPHATRSLMVIPMVLGEITIGVLQIQSASRNLYSEENIKMLSLLTTQAIALFQETRSRSDLYKYTNNILQSIATGVVALDAEGIITACNTSAERILRRSAREVIGVRFVNLVESLETDQQTVEATMQLISNAASATGIGERKLLRYFQNTTPVSVIGCASQFRSEQGKILGTVFVFDDVTNEEKLEREVRRMAHLAETGQLAAGIAHELRNPLASIKGAAQVLKESLPEPIVIEHGEFLDIIVNEVDTLNALTTEFLEFSRPNMPTLKPINIKKLIERRLKVLRFEFELRDVSLHKEIEESASAAIEADSTMIEQVVNNIVLNALQAMPDGGLLTVQLTGASKYGIPGVQMIFADSGIGIDKERIASIFKPFFTTKTKGIGLGLSIVEKNIEQHGGTIEVESTLKKGSKFVIWLPLTAQNRPALPNILSETEISQERKQDPRSRIKSSAAIPEQRLV
jgi:PAS domain S-box-containing protein